MNKTTRGFTIVELLIVIVVIAILAAISIVAYTGIQNRTYDSAVKSDLANFAKTLELVKIDNNDTYPASFTKDMGFAFSRGAYAFDGQSYTLRYCRNASTNDYIMYARSKSGNYFRVTATGGVQDAVSAYGYSVCSQIGLSSTNPSANVVHATNGWSTWVN